MSDKAERYLQISITRRYGVEDVEATVGGWFTPSSPADKKRIELDLYDECASALFDYETDRLPVTRPSQKPKPSPSGKQMIEVLKVDEFILLYRTGGAQYKVLAGNYRKFGIVIPPPLVKLYCIPYLMGDNTRYAPEGVTVQIQLTGASPEVLSIEGLPPCPSLATNPHST